MTVFRSSFVVGVGLFLIVDMVVVHQLLRFHGLLFSDLFEYLVLVLALLLTWRGIRGIHGNTSGRISAHGIVSGIGGTLFFDVVIIDTLLKLHEVHYSQTIHLLSGLVGFLLFALPLTAFLWKRDSG